MEKELLFSLNKKDFELQFFRAGGKGGQKQNKTSSACRIIHKESGAVGESREERSQHANRKIAFDRLTKSSKFKVWLNMRIFECVEKISIDKKIEDSMVDSNLLVEVKDENDNWVDINSKK